MKMKQFMDEDFLLKSKTAIRLYHDCAKNMPIFDYHCHLSPKEIAEDKSYQNITELWLGGDHYKWRAMRSNGIAEKYITGDADDKAKFMKWAETMPYCIGNPLYHWAHLELKRYFGINEVLSPETAEMIWNKCNQALQTKEFSTRNLIKRSNVQVICTTDDPLDSLEYHQAIAGDPSFNVKVLPAFRPDKSLNIEKAGFTEWMRSLGKLAGYEIDTFAALKNALQQRIEFFHQHGARISDHGVDTIVYRESTEAEATAILQKALIGMEITETEIHQYKTQVMLFLGRQYASRNWTMQLHIGALRNNNQRMFKRLGPDTGFDAITNYSYAESLAKLLDKLDETTELPKTILYCLNPNDNEILGAMIGCFQSDSTPGKIQFGPAWWFNDQKDGMIRQMLALANLGLLSKFVGMLTDSRSFLSYTRHEYFRRILCDLIGEWVENGEVPDDQDLLCKIIQDICYHNAVRYFELTSP
jgi:glucuronate isomerase